MFLTRTGFISTKEERKHQRRICWEPQFLLHRCRRPGCYNLPESLPTHKQQSCVLVALLICQPTQKKQTDRILLQKEAPMKALWFMMNGNHPNKHILDIKKELKTTKTSAPSNHKECDTTRTMPKPTMGTIWHPHPILRLMTPNRRAA